MARLIFLIVVLILLATVVQLGMISIAFDKLGLSQGSAYLLLLVTLFGSLINVPLYTVHGKEPRRQEAKRQSPFRLFGGQGGPYRGHTLVAVNIGGAVVPTAFSVYLLLHNPLDSWQVVDVVGIVAAISYLTSRPIAGVGIGIPLFLAPLTAALVAVALNREAAAPLAYIGGTLGVLIGADLLRLPMISKLESPFASIGGAGSFDGIFLSGMLAVLIA